MELCSQERWISTLKEKTGQQSESTVTWRLTEAAGLYENLLLLESNSEVDKWFLKRALVCFVGVPKEDEWEN